MVLRLATLVVLLLAAASSTSVAQISNAQTLSLQVLRGQAAAAQNSFAYPVDGIVLNAVTGEGIHNALVSIYLGSDLSSLLTGPDGKFHFDHVPPGELGITVQKPGFFTEQQLTTGQLSAPVNVAADMAPVVLKLVPEGVIFGRITDSDGEPVEGAIATASYAEVEDGRRSFRQQYGAQTNSEGEFRVFELRPGTYYLWAGRESPTFYPGVRDVGSAMPIRVMPGQQIHADFQMQPDVMFRISGIVSGMPPGVNVNLNLATSILGFGSSYGVAVGRDGSFAQVVPAGRYVLRASAPVGDGELAASVPMNVTANTVGVRLVLAPTATIPVNVDFALTRKASPGLPDGEPGVSVRLIPSDGALTNQEYDAIVRLDLPPEQRTFAVRNVDPGAYRVEIAPSGDWYVAAARRGGTDLLNQDLVVNSGGVGEPIEVTVRDDFASVLGTVSSDGQPALGSVLLIPERTEERAIIIPVSATGRFRMDAVPPGEYTAIAFDRNEDVEYRNPEAMRPYANGAEFVRLPPSGEGSVNLQLQKRREH